MLEAINAVLGILDMNPCPLTPEINRLIQEREQARQRKDWNQADAARQELLKMGINVLDTASGPVWERVERNCTACADLQSAHCACR